MDPHRPGPGHRRPVAAAAGVGAEIASHHADRATVAHYQLIARPVVAQVEFACTTIGPHRARARHQHEVVATSDVLAHGAYLRILDHPAVVHQQLVTWTGVAHEETGGITPHRP